MYLPSFHNITRLDNRMVNGGSCIDNIFLKSNNVNSYACKFLNPITDHYSLYYDILYKKLYRYGIKGLALDLIRDYLTDRVYVSIYNTYV